MPKIDRHDLKRDEVRETFEHGAEAVLAHQKLAIYLVVVAVVIAGGVFGWLAYSQHQTAMASAAYADAQVTYSAPVGSAPQPGQLSFVDDNAKMTAAIQKFKQVADKYPHTRPGKLALYFEAVSQARLNKNAEAKALLQKLTGDSDDEISTLARFSLAQIDDQMGNPTEAASLYQQLLAKPTLMVPKQMVLYYLGEHYIQSDPAQAAKLFQQIKSGYPDTPLAQQADQELSLIPGKS
jgi:predicted negative regulator of RcsB-dependent stress response